MIGVNVKGGTGAGVKRPPRERRWIHDCPDWPGAGGLVLSSYSCPHCGARRPARPFPTNSTAPVIIER